MSTTLYRRPIVTPLNRAQHIRAAYQAAGVEPPQYGAAMARVLNDAPTPDAVAAELVTQGYQAEDAQTWHAEAMEAMSYALANERLRLALGKRAPSLEAEHADDWTDLAARDLTAPFNRLVKKLTEAAGKLPDGPNAFDLEAVVAADAGAAYSTAREALATLSGYAGIHGPLHLNDGAVRWGELLGIVDVPQTVMEQRTRHKRLARNAAQLDTTMDARAILQLIEKGETDRAILDVVRGRFKGFALKLADSAELREREDRITRALTYTAVDDD